MPSSLLVPARLWGGNVAYNDNHVSRETNHSPDGLSFWDPNAGSGGSGGSQVADNIFVDESNENGGSLNDIAGRANVILRLAATGVDWHNNITSGLFKDAMCGDGKPE